MLIWLDGWIEWAICRTDLARAAAQAGTKTIVWVRLLEVVSFKMPSHPIATKKRSPQEAGLLNTVWLPLSSFFLSCDFRMKYRSFHITLHWSTARDVITILLKFPYFRSVVCGVFWQKIRNTTLFHTMMSDYSITPKVSVFVNVLLIFVLNWYSILLLFIVKCYILLLADSVWYCLLTW